MEKTEPKKKHTKGLKDRRNYTLKNPLKPIRPNNEINNFARSSRKSFILEKKWSVWRIIISFLEMLSKLTWFKGPRWAFLSLITIQRKTLINMKKIKNIWRICPASEQMIQNIRLGLTIWRKSVKSWKFTKKKRIKPLIRETKRLSREII